MFCSSVTPSNSSALYVLQLRHQQYHCAIVLLYNYFRGFTTDREPSLYTHALKCFFAGFLAYFKLQDTFLDQEILDAFSEPMFNNIFSISCILLHVKTVPLQAWSGPEGSRKLRFPYYMTTAQNGGKVVSLTHRPPLPLGNAPGTHFCWRLGRPQGHSASVNEAFQ
jgi:hypothetical protein